MLDWWERFLFNIFLIRCRRLSPVFNSLIQNLVCPVFDSHSSFSFFFVLSLIFPFFLLFLTDICHSVLCLEPSLLCTYTVRAQACSLLLAFCSWVTRAIPFVSHSFPSLPSFALFSPFALAPLPPLLFSSVGLPPYLSFSFLLSLHLSLSSTAFSLPSSRRAM